MLQWSMYSELRRPRPVEVAVLRDDAFGAVETYTIPYDGIYAGAISGTYDARIEELIAGSWYRVQDVNRFQPYLARANQTRIKNYSGSAFGIVVFRGVVDGRVRGFRVMRKIFEGTLAGYATQTFSESGLFMIVARCPYGLAVDYYSRGYDAWWESYALNSVYAGYVAVGYALAPVDRFRVRNKSSVSVAVKVYVVGWV